jgi:hypothetical protein
MGVGRRWPRAAPGYGVADYEPFPLPPTSFQGDTQPSEETWAAIRRRPASRTLDVGIKSWQHRWQQHRRFAAQHTAQYGASSEGEPGLSGCSSELMMPGSRLSPAHAIRGSGSGCVTTATPAAESVGGCAEVRALPPSPPSSTANARG